jgi:N-carbamoyl-L-amino-acid hydrolase
MDWTQLRIDEKRFRTDFEALSQFGNTGDGGVNRPALSPAHLAARAWLKDKIGQAGLEFRVDAAGNHSAKLACGPEGAPSLLIGSHLDSVPNGGRFDGALGVLAGLEALRCISQAGLRLPVNLELIDFTDEEGTLVSFFGSGALTGLLNPEDFSHPRAGRQALEEGLSRAGISEEDIPSARRNPKTIAGYLELHIEQGLQLSLNQNQIGVVMHIPGIAFYRLAFTGQAGHAGTIPVSERLDAGWGASAFSLSVRRIMIESFPDCFANIGRVTYAPGAFNIVPGKAVLTLEFRSACKTQFERLEPALLEQANQDANRFGLGLEIEFLGKHDPVEMSPLARKAILEASQHHGLRAAEIESRAGHDAQLLAAVCPSGMIFVPSVEGISHSPHELTEWSDCANGANVLLQAALRMARHFA